MIQPYQNSEQSMHRFYHLEYWLETTHIAFHFSAYPSESSYQFSQHIAETLLNFERLQPYTRLDLLKVQLLYLVDLTFLPFQRLSVIPTLSFDLQVLV